jgi:signal recognition particle GTPase
VLRCIQSENNPVEIAQNAIKHAKWINVVIVDTAGRLAVDEEMMNEIERVIKRFSQMKPCLL